LEGGAAAGQITSAAELQLASGSRVFALAMMRGEAEAHNETFAYTVKADPAGGSAGTARILSAPPNFS
jgi:hypothetical protein